MDDPVHDPASIYLDMMVQIRTRLALIDRCANADIAAPLFDEEFLMIETVMLQLRMICEMIAFACLAAHDPNPRKDLRKAYSASKIFFELSRLKPEFYPEPLLSSTDSSGLIHHSTRLEAITRKEIEALYEYCNEHLHRARYSEILANQRRIYRSDYLLESRRRIEELLDVHMIRIASPDRLIRVTMTGPRGGVRWDTLALLPRDQ